MAHGALERDAVEQVLYVRPHDLLAADLPQGEHLAVDVGDRSIRIADGDGIARHLDEPGDVTQFLVVHAFHARPPADSTRRGRAQSHDRVR